MYFMTRIIVNFLILTRFVYCDTMPEDLITDNDEQLAKLKRDDFVDSLRGQVPSMENQEKHEQKEESESTRHSSSTENDTHSISSLKSTFPLSSVFPSPSAFSFGNKDSITISTSKHVMLSLAPNSTTALENNTRNKLNYKTPALSNYSLGSRTTTSMAVEISKTFVEDGKHNINHTQTKLYVAPSSLSFSTDIKSIISVLITSAPAAHSISSISDTAQSKLEPKRSVFNSGVVSNSIAVNEMSTTVSPQTGISGKTITPGDTSITSGISSKKMPVLPELHENGGRINKFVYHSFNLLSRVNSLSYSLK